MKRNKLGAALALVLSCFSGVLQGAAQDLTTRPVFIQGTYHGVSPTARDLYERVVAPAQHVMPLLHQHPVPYGVNPTAAYDFALRQPVGSQVSTTAGLNLLGLGIGFGTFTICCAPPDTNASVGTTQVVETVNDSYVVFTKSTGAKAGGPFSLTRLYTGVGNNCEKGFVTDPIIKFDRIHSRWVITYLAATPNGPPPLGVSSPFLQCIAVSKTSDALGSYFLYAFDLTGLGGLNDYGKMGIWPDAYYISFNVFATNGSGKGASPCAFQSGKMISGLSAGVVCFLPISTEFTLLPSDLDGANLPVAGEPNMLVGTLSEAANTFHLLKFHVNFTTPSSSTLTAPKVLTAAAFSEACGGGTCIPQPTGGELLDSLADRMMFRAAYRKFVGTGAHEAIVVSHSVVAGSRTAPRWYEIRNPNGTTPFIFQQGTVAPADSNFRWMPSVGMDKNGDIALGYSVSSSATKPSIRYTGRVPTDAKGTMQAEKTIVTGTGVQQSNTFHRWGDYSSMAIDPSDDCTFWYAQEYIKTSGTFSWSTRLASFKFNTCQ